MVMYKTAWRVLARDEKVRFAVGMRRLNLGVWGYAASTLRAVHLTTREGNDNTTKVFSHDLRELVLRLRESGYDLQYCGSLEYTPGKGLLHWHGLFRVKGGYFPLTRRELGDIWNEIHNAFVVKITKVDTKEQLKKYILKHIMKEYVGQDEAIRNKFLFSKGWMREGWKKVEDLAKLWTLGGLESDGGLSALFMNKERWDKVNEVVQAWAERRSVMIYGDVLNGKLTGYLSMELGRIREAFGSASVIIVDGKAQRSSFEYLDY